MAFVNSNYGAVAIVMAPPMPEDLVAWLETPKKRIPDGVTE